jgi:drug/metabolite transporter (DMT)-like permease
VPPVRCPINATLPSLGVVAAECAIATVVLAPVAVTRLPKQIPNLEVPVSLLVLGLICTALAYLTFFALIAEVGASRGTVFTYINPGVSVLLGVILLDESLNMPMIVGFLLIIAGSYLSTSDTLPRVGNNLGVESQVFIEEQIKPFMQEKLVCREE